MSEGQKFQLGTIGALSLSVVSSVLILVCNKALISTLGFTFEFYFPADDEVGEYGFGGVSANCPIGIQASVICGTLIGEVNLKNPHEPCTKCGRK